MKIGILGGTFNPVHNGHLAVAQAVHDQLQLDKILLIPSSNPPHKEETELIDYEDRWQMLERAVATSSYLEISHLDYTPEGKSYTKNLMIRLREHHPATTFYFIIGADNISQIATWYDFPWLMKHVNFVAVTRENFERESLPDLDYFSQITFVEMEPVNISSSRIRQLISKGEDISSLVPPSVAQYISQKGLYLPKD